MKPIIGWRDTRYFYCMSHSTSQVNVFKYFTEDEEGYWSGRKCDWCRKQIKKERQQ